LLSKSVLERCDHCTKAYSLLAEQLLSKLKVLSKALYFSTRRIANVTKHIGDQPPSGVAE
jgi:hypothetical protein